MTDSTTRRSVSDGGTDAENSWGRTLEDASHRAEALEGEGWTVDVVRSGHVAPVGPDAEGADVVGILFVVPSESGEAFADLVDGGVTDYVVFTEREGDTRYLVVEVRDSDRRHAALLVGALPLDHADSLAEHAHETGRVRTHVRALDETHYGTVEHDDPSLFFPR